jgi:uncharacterized protein
MTNISKKLEHAAFFPVPLANIKIKDSFWSPRQSLLSSSILHQYNNLERTHHIDNFRIAANLKQSAFVGIFFYDSDLYKWLEAATYCLHLGENDALRQKVEAIVHIVVGAQGEDGYINTFFTVNFPDERMKNFYTMHEMYCCGHLIEAAVARYVLEDKDDLLDVAKRFADFLIAFDPDNKDTTFVPGHQEIELALVKLYRCTNDTKYLDFAMQLIDKRGHNPHLTRTAFQKAISTARLLTRQRSNLSHWEAAHGKIEEQGIDMGHDTVAITASDLFRFIASFLNGQYVQQHVPVRDQSEPVGHAVRAMYMYSAMTDIFMETGDKSLLDALQAIWANLTEKRMFITGGVGSLPLIEGFGKDYELDNQKAYCETCAAIGNFLWNWRMLQATGECKYADLMERILYNAILAGWSIDGTKFRYSNPLATKKGKPHQEWFAVACCPSNISRIVGSLGQYIASTDGTNSLWIHQYIGSALDFALDDGTRLQLAIDSEFPWSGHASVTLTSSPPVEFILNLRVPSWAHDVNISIDGTEIVKKHDWGVYLPIKHEWNSGNKIDVEFGMPAEFLLPDPHVRTNRGRVAITRGPIVYAIEAADNTWYKYGNLAIDIPGQLQSMHEPEKLGGVMTVHGTGSSAGNKVAFTAIPYFTHGNRAPGPMEVWINAKH